MKYTIYHLVANQGGRYTKHIYIGDERIVSKIGDFASYGPDPRRIEYAGSEADAVTVDYDVKYSQQLQAIKDNYATFGVPYNGTDNDDYVNGEGFCCDDGSLEAAQAEAVAQANAPDGNFQEGDAYENLQFYYHPDHLGSTSYVTNLDGEVVQHVEYVPFGEVFIEERNNTWNTPYLFNAKEFDEETGLYYYGARYYDPRLSLWMSTDPAEEKYPDISSYAYCFNNPLKIIDPIGTDTVDLLPPSGYDLDNQVLRLDMKYLDDDPNVINVWGHGSSTGIDYNGTNIGTAEELNKVLKEHSSVWKNHKQGDDAIIVLHSCYTSEFAKKVSESEIFENVLIIAPNRNVQVRYTSLGQKYVHTGVSDNKSANYANDTGLWIGYQGGEIYRTYKGDFYGRNESHRRPGGKGFSYFTAWDNLKNLFHKINIFK